MNWLQTIHKNSRHAGLVIIMALIAGCSGGDAIVDDSSWNDSNGPGDTSNSFPLNIGDRWIYRKSDSSGVQSLKMDFVSGTATIQGLTTYVHQRKDVATGTSESGKDYYLKNSHGVFTLAPENKILIYGQSRIQILKFPIQLDSALVSVNEKGIDFGSDLDGDGKNEQLDVTAETVVDAIESVTIAAGTFDKVARVRTVVNESIHMTDSSKIQQRQITYTDWYAPGIGLIKNKQVGVYPETTVTDELELTNYMVGGVSSSTLPLKFASVTPTQDSKVVASDWKGPITAKLNQPIDVTTVPNSILVTDTTGNAITGVTTVTASDQLQFHPQQAMPPGTYRVTLSPASKDLLGRNAASGMAWQFIIEAPDTVSPRTVTTTPMNGAKDVALDTAVTIEFDDPLDLASITPSSFVIKETEAEAGIMSMTVTVKNFSVTLEKPNKVRISIPLSYSKTYEITTAGDTSPVKDLAGNAVSGLLTSFSTGAGIRFQSNPPSSFFPFNLAAETIATGDVNGDGKNDLIVGSSSNYAFNTTNNASIGIFSNISAASLGSPSIINIANDSVCQINQIQIGDITGDGLKDIVAYGRGCGLFVLERKSGPWEVTARYPESPGYLFSKMKVVDMKGDGRNGVAIADYDSIQLLRQTPQGKLDNSVTLKLPAVNGPIPADMYTTNFDVADVNGDGLSDILVVRYTGNEIGSAFIYIQNSNGTFTNPIYLSQPETFTSFQPRSVAISNINHNGKKYIIINGYENSTSLSLYRYTPSTNGSMEAPVLMSGTISGDRVVTADMNGDGLDDLIVSAWGRDFVEILLQKADGSLSRGVPISLDRCIITDPIVIGDINSDGLADIMTFCDMQQFQVTQQQAIAVNALSSKTNNNQILLRKAALTTYHPMTYHARRNWWSVQ